jgi:hypothetical protein
MCRHRDNRNQAALYFRGREAKKLHVRRTSGAAFEQGQGRRHPAVVGSSKDNHCLIFWIASDRLSNKEVQ